MERTKPTTAMGKAEVYPSVPDNMELLSANLQAEIAVQINTKGAEAFAITEANRQALIDWINKEPVKDVE